MAFEIYKYVAMVTQSQINYQILLEQSCFSNVEPQDGVGVGDPHSTQHTIGAIGPIGRRWRKAKQQPPPLSNSPRASEISHASRKWNISIFK